MKMITTVFGMLMALAIIPSVNGATEEATSIEAGSQLWLAAFNKGDTRALSKMYTTDAVVMPPSSEILSDPVSIQSYWDGLRGIGVNDFEVYTVNTQQEGDTVYQSGVWEATRTTAKGDSIRFDGNINSVLEKQKDGSWKIKLQSWN